MADSRLFKLILWLFSGFMIVLLMSSCAPDPRREAQAFQIREQAEQDALNQEQNRIQDEQLHQFQLQQLAVEQAHREATAAEWRAGLNYLIRWSFTVGTFAVAVLIVVFGMALSVGALGIGQATAQAANLKARLIYLDPATGQFPMITYSGNGHYTLTDPNTKYTIYLDSRNESDAQLIAGALAIRQIGVQTRNAGRTDDAASVSQVQPMIIDGKDVATEALQMATLRGGSRDENE